LPPGSPDGASQHVATPRPWIDSRSNASTLCTSAKCGKPEPETYSSPFSYGNVLAQRAPRLWPGPATLRDPSKLATPEAKCRMRGAPLEDARRGRDLAVST